MSPSDLVSTVAGSTESLLEWIDADAIAAIVPEFAVSDVIETAADSIDAVSAPIVRTARTGWRLRRPLLIAALVVATIGVVAALVKRRRERTVHRDADAAARDSGRADARAVRSR